MEVNVLLTIAYDGTAYLGWQKSNLGPTIENSLELVISNLLDEPIYLQAASRTDAGVHAKGQLVNFYTKTKLPSLDSFQESINHLLPKDITVLKVEIVPDDFHPTLDCIGKEYHYHVCYGPIQSPFFRHYSWHYPHNLDLACMREAAEKFVGIHNFSAFCNSKQKNCYPHFEREIYFLKIDHLVENRLCFKIYGNKFLYKMVRNLVGTLVYVGCGKIDKNQMVSFLKDEDRTQIGITAPALGLSLISVNSSQ